MSGVDNKQSPHSCSLRNTLVSRTWTLLLARHNMWISSQWPRPAKGNDVLGSACIEHKNTVFWNYWIWTTRIYFFCMLRTHTRTHAHVHTRTNPHTNSHTYMTTSTYKQTKAHRCARVCVREIVCVCVCVRERVMQWTTSSWPCIICNATYQKYE